MSDGEQNAECEGEAKTENPIKSQAEAEAADGAEQSFPGQGIVLQAACGAVEFNGNGDAGGNAGGKSKKESEAKTVADAEDDGVSNRPGQQPQGAIPST